MEKKGFTLVELLAVIAILAILVIVAMPNVLGMFNQAKVNSFVTEVQKIMDTATTTFTKDALANSGKSVYYSSESNATLKTKPLDMSGNKKNYFIEMDRNGDFKRVLIYDDNYCYDVYSDYFTNAKFKIGSSKISKIMTNYNEEELVKTNVRIDNVWESGNDSISVVINGDNYTIKGCEASISVTGETFQVEQVKIGSNYYSYVPGMTWYEWINSNYNTGGFRVAGSDRVVDSTGDYVCYTNLVCTDQNCFGLATWHDVDYRDQIINNEDYILDDFPTSDGIIVGNGDRYYDYKDNNGVFLYNQELKVWED